MFVPTPRMIEALERARWRREVEWAFSPNWPPEYVEAAAQLAATWPATFDPNPLVADLVEHRQSAERTLSMVRVLDGVSGLTEGVLYATTLLDLVHPLAGIEFVAVATDRATHYARTHRDEVEARFVEAHREETVARLAAVYQKVSRVFSNLFFWLALGGALSKIFGESTATFE